MADLWRLLRDLGRIHTHLAAAVNQRLRSEFGLSLMLIESMTVIAEVDGCRTNDLAAGLGVTSGGASKLADRLCALGYCRRIPNPGDRRSRLLKLTPAGHRRLAQIRHAAENELERQFAALFSPTQISHLAAAFRTTSRSR